MQLICEALSIKDGTYQVGKGCSYKAMLYICPHRPGLSFNNWLSISWLAGHARQRNRAAIVTVWAYIQYGVIYIVWLLSYYTATPLYAETSTFKTPYSRSNFHAPAPCGPPERCKSQRKIYILILRPISYGRTPSSQAGMTPERSTLLHRTTIDQ